MPDPTRMTIDGTGATPCTLELYVGGVLATSISYFSGGYTLPARLSPINVTQPDYSKNMRELSQWQNIIRSLWPNSIIEPEQDWHAKRSSVKWEFALDFIGPKIIDAEKTLILPYVTFKQRQAFSLTPGQFDLYWQRLNHIMGLVF